MSGLIGGNSHLGGTFTGNWHFTIALSVIACLVWLYAGLKEGGMGYIKHYWVIPIKGQPVALIPLLVPIGIMIAVLEIAGNVLIKPFALCVRLVANMMAGHTMLKVFGGFVVVPGVVGVAPLALIVALTAFEILVEVLQAYVFTILTCLYLHDAIHLH